MRHRVSGRKFNRTSSHRRAMLVNLAKSLIEHEQLKTTLPKAKDLRPVMEKLVTKARAGGLHIRRQLIASLRCEKTAEMLIAKVAPRFNGRPGGYTRIIKAGFRYGDYAPMAVIEFVDFNPLSSNSESSPVPAES